jgi:hypothetical protein
MMSVSNDSTSTGNGVSLSSTFLDFCVKVRNSDPSILPEPGYPFKIRRYLSEKEHMALADALLENTNVTYLELDTAQYTKSSAEAMAKYVRTSNRLQRIRLGGDYPMVRFRQHEEKLCYFLLAIQEITSLKELRMALPRGGEGPAYPELMVSDSNLS